MFDINDYNSFDFNSMNTFSLIDENTFKLLITFLLVFIITFLIIYTIKCIAMWKLFKKANTKEIYSVIPIYNKYILYQISGLEGWYIFLMFIPFIGFLITSIFNIICNFKLSKSFGKDYAFAIGLLLLPAIFLPVLAFGKSTYIGPNGIKKDETI